MDDATKKTSDEGVTQGFSAVSPEAMKFLQQTDGTLNLDTKNRQKFILTKQTLAKRPAEFGQTIEKKPRRTSMNKQLVVGLLAVIGVLFVGIISAVIMIGAVNNKSETSGGGGATAEEDVKFLPSGVGVTRIDDEIVQFAAANIVDGVTAIIDEPGAYSADQAEEAVFLVINGGKLYINADVEITKQGTGAAIVVVGEDCEANINGATIITEEKATQELNGGKITLGSDVKIVQR